MSLGVPPHLSPHVLVVADDRTFVDRLVPELVREGFVPAIASSVGDTIRELEGSPDVAVVDAELSVAPCRLLCTVIRAASPVRLVVVGSRRQPTDVVAYLDAGADDCLDRPDRHRELIARIRALLRRDPVAPPGVTTEANRRELLYAGDVHLDAGKHEVRVDGRLVDLPLKQFNLLAFLLERAGRVVSRRSILDGVWGGDVAVDSATLEVQISRLREKIEADPGHPRRIKTVRGVGYLFDDTGRS